MKVLCSVCDLWGPGRLCDNFWCRREDRAFDVVWAAGGHGGGLREALAALKYRGDRRRAPGLATLLAGVLLAHPGAFEDVDLIVGMPGLPTPARPVDHVHELMVELAGMVGDLWPLDVDHPVLVKRAPTTSMVELASAAARRLWAAGELRAALVVSDPPRVVGQRIVVVDDVFTDGSTMREAAIALRRAGAFAVSGLVVARRGHQGHPGIRRRPW